jgi:hypothetical protein
MERYLVFSGRYYYPSGGWGDFCGSRGTPEEAEQFGYRIFEQYGNNWFHVVDTETREILLNRNSD